MRGFASDLILLDDTLHDCGPQAAPVRALLRGYVARAWALSASIFLVSDMDEPFDGLIKVSSEPMRNALAHMTP